MDTKKVLKNSLIFVASVGTTAVVAAAIKSYTPVDPKLLTKIAFPVGAFVLTGIAANAAGSYVETEFDKLDEEIKAFNTVVEQFTTKSEED